MFGIGIHERKRIFLDIIKILRQAKKKGSKNCPF
jgi:hypothetical protein